MEAAVAPRPGSAIEVIAEVAAEYGLQLDAVSVLLGFIVRSEWDRLKPRLVAPDAARGEAQVETLDASALREYLVVYFEATGRSRVAGASSG